LRQASPPRCNRALTQRLGPSPAAAIALFTDFAELANMVSIGTLFVFWVVALAQIWKRSFVPGVTSAKNKLITTVHLVALVGFSLGACTAVVAAACPSQADPLMKSV
jgi:FtsH-binding integral membrane protein